MCRVTALTCHSGASTTSFINSQYARAPPTKMKPQRMNAGANEPVRCAIAPVSHGAMMPPTLPPKFWIPDTVPTTRLVLHACVRLHVLGEARPRPQRDVSSNHTDVRLS